MKFIEKTLSKFGYRKTPTVPAKRKTTKTRSYKGAKIDRFTQDFIPGNLSSDEELKVALRILRARSRYLVNNNDYAKKFQNLLKTNVIGPSGIRLQNKAKQPDGSLDAGANRIIEEAWTEWSKKENCSVCGTLTLQDMADLVIQSVAQDGEILIEKVKSFRDNDFRYALRVYEADHLDEGYFDEFRNGNVVKMGVEKNSYQRPVAYYIYSVHPGDFTIRRGDRYYIRVPAKDLEHIFIKHRISQSRGVPWFHTAIFRLNMIGAYEEAELIASRISASKMGFFTSPSGDEYIGQDRDEDDQIVMEAEPGSFEELPAGMDLRMFDPQHPTTNFRDFVRGILKGASSGLNVAYTSLSSDYESINYSSARSAILEERDNWKKLQKFITDHFYNPIFTDWLRYQLSIGRKINLPFTKFDKFNSPMWIGRGWGWVDPQKDVNANATAYDKGFKSLQDIVSESGKDIETIFEEQKAEKELRKKFGLNQMDGGTDETV